MGLKQKTMKTVEDVLLWIHTNEHHIVGGEYKDGAPFEAGPTHHYYQNHFEKMRVPAKLFEELKHLLQPNKRAFDTRMFALTKEGKRRLYRWAYSNNPIIPANREEAVACS